MNYKTCWSYSVTSTYSSYFNLFLCFYYYDNVWTINYKTWWSFSVISSIYFYFKILLLLLLNYYKLLFFSSVLRRFVCAVLYCAVLLLRRFVCAVMSAPFCPAPFCRRTHIYRWFPAKWYFRFSLKSGYILGQTFSNFYPDFLTV